MPRSGPLGTFTLPGAQATQQPNTPIPSAVNNQGWSDVEQTFNTVTPEAYGGTGASTYAQARANLGVSTSAVAAMNTRRNRVVNHDMRISQENGTTSGTGNGFYPVDQWAQYRVTSAGVLTVQQVASVTPAGSPNRLRATVTTPDTALAAGEYWVLSQNIEGSNVADFRYGSASAVASVARFGFRGPAGTYAAHIGNSAANRSYVALFTIAGGQANTDTVQTFAIPGDTTGTWLTADGVIGLTLDVVLAAGSASQGVAGWQAGNILATSAISNGMGTGGAVFELFDVGLRLDPDATGVYGQYEVGEVSTVYRSERYWEKSYDSADGPGTASNSGSFSVRVAAGGNATLSTAFRYQKAKTSPTVVPYSTSTGSSGLVRNVSAGSDITSSITVGSKAFDMNATAVSGELIRFQWTASARLS